MDFVKEITNVKNVPITSGPKEGRLWNVSFENAFRQLKYSHIPCHRLKKDVGGSRVPGRTDLHDDKEGKSEQSTLPEREKPRILLQAVKACKTKRLERLQCITHVWLKKTYREGKVLVFDAISFFGAHLLSADFE